MKILSKAHIMREKKMNYAIVERDVLTKLNHPNIIRLLLTFQDPGNLYYVIELAQNGDLQTVLTSSYAIDIPIAKIILGQILLAISHMHKNRILHRDIKPENILLDDRNRVKITDFGTAKIFSNEKNVPFRCEHGSFVGSADYVSPETIQETTLGPASDLWSFGCLVYALLVGYAPFHSDSNYATFMKIEANKFDLPDFLPDSAKDLISKILVSDPTKRLGCDQFDTDYAPIRNHPFFDGLNWNEVPLKPIEEFRSFQPAVIARDDEIQKAKKSRLCSLSYDDGSIFREGNVMFIDQKSGETKIMCLVLTSPPKPMLLLTDIEKTQLKECVRLGFGCCVEKVEPSKLRIKGVSDKYEVDDKFHNGDDEIESGREEEERTEFFVIVEEAEADRWVEATQMAMNNEG